MHTCYASNMLMPLQKCNDEIAKHALLHGVSYGSVNAFMKYTPANEMVYLLGEKAEYWGLTRHVGEESSDFEKSEPCVFELITGRSLLPQTAWRVEIKGHKKIITFRKPKITSYGFRYASIGIIFKVAQTIPMLTKADEIQITIRSRKPYKPIILNINLKKSRKNLIFEANKKAAMRGLIIII